MRILNRYLFNAVTGATFLVLFVLLAIGGFVEFVGQLDDIGEGDYNMLQAIQFSLLKLPKLAAGMLPVSALLGSLLGLGALASNSELIVMRAAGVSASRLGMSVGIAGLTLAIIGGVLGEYVAPQMDMYGRQMKAVAQSGSADITGSSAWLRSGDAFFHIRPSNTGRDYGGVYVYHLEGEGRLKGIGKARVQENIDGSWSLESYRESRFRKDGVRLSKQFDVERINELSDLLAITAVRESSLTGEELWAYVQYLKANGLESDRYEIALWSRISSLVGIIVMCVLALPFVFGSLRNAGTGARMLIGVFFGLGYFLLGRTLTDSSAVFELSPVVVAWVPTAVLFLITVVLLRRVN